MKLHAHCFGWAQMWSLPRSTIKTDEKPNVVLEEEFGKERVLFVATDVGDEASVKNLYNLSMLAFGKVDAVINNATIAVLGQVKDLPIEEWDKSYHVNLRGPVLMAKTFLPDMIQRNHGDIRMCLVHRDSFSRRI